MTREFRSLIAALSVGTALGLPLAAQAQSLAYGDVSGGGTTASYGRGDVAQESDDDGGDAPVSRAHGGKKIKVTPYIEAQQVVFADLKPGNEILTYSVLSAGVDAAIAGRNNQASISARYERRFGWGNATDSDSVSGVAGHRATTSDA